MRTFVADEDFVANEYVVCPDPRAQRVRRQRDRGDEHLSVWAVVDPVMKGAMLIENPERVLRAAGRSIHDGAEQMVERLAGELRRMPLPPDPFEGDLKTMADLAERHLEAIRQLITLHGAAIPS